MASALSENISSSSKLIQQPKAQGKNKENHILRGILLTNAAIPKRKDATGFSFNSKTSLYCIERKGSIGLGKPGVRHSSLKYTPARKDTT